mgnify:CR=1 FL=1
MDIQWRPGSQNRADALSRRPDYVPPTVELAALTASDLLPDNDFLTSVKSAYGHDPLYQRGRRPAFIKEREGLFYVGSRLCIPKDEAVCLRVLHDCHDAPYRGHPGVQRTLAVTTQHFWWPHMARTVRAYVAACATCQRTKSSSQLTPGTLQPMPIPKEPWSVVGMDLITDLPQSGGYDTIVSFVDLFTKAAHFTPTNKTCSAQQLATLFLNNVYRHHSLPKVLVSDRDPRITSVFFKTLFTKLGSRFNISTSYHPQTDGQTERTNRTIQQILRSYVHPFHDDWADYLPIAEAAYNQAVSSATGVSPFEAMYGYMPRTPATAALSPSHVPAADSYIRRMEDIRALIRANLEKAKAQQSVHADTHHRDLIFSIGDKVRLDTEHLQLVDQPCSKFRDRYVGPFTVAEVISPVVYRLNLPASMTRVHPVFHISRLLPWHEDTEHPNHVPPDRPMPAVTDSFTNGYLVHKLLDVKIGPDPRYRGQALLFKVKWASPYEGDEHDTWEPYRNVAKLDALQDFLTTPAWHRFKTSNAYTAFRRKYPRKLPSLPSWLPT